jgi:hypothetical protein
MGKAYQARIKVYDIETLEIEKQRLKRMCRQMEREMNSRLDHVKDHYGSMAFNSLFPGADGESNIFKWGLRLGKSAWESEHIRSFLTTAIFSVVEFIAVRLGINFFNKHFGEKHKKQD